MTQSPSNESPTSGTTAFSPEEALQFMQRMWNPFGVPIPGFPLPGTVAPGATGAAFAGMGFPSPAAMFATLDPAEIERKIGELRVIEGWLQMSLNLMQMSIRTLELQKASLESLRASQASAPSAGESGSRKKK